MESVRAWQSCECQQALVLVSGGPALVHRDVFRGGPRMKFAVGRAGNRMALLTAKYVPDPTGGAGRTANSRCWFPAGTLAGFKQRHARLVLLLSDETQAGGAMNTTTLPLPCTSVGHGRECAPTVRRRRHRNSWDVGCKWRRRQHQLGGQRWCPLMAAGCSQPPQGRTS